MTSINQLFDAYDHGRISRRGLMSALVPLFAATPALAADTLSIKTVNHVTLSVSDIERSQKFYQDIFSAPVVSKQANGINLAAGPSSFIGLFKMPSASPSIHHFCLGIDGLQVDSARVMLEGRGLKPTVRDRDGVKELYLRDPDGLQVQLQDVGYRG